MRRFLFLLAGHLGRTVAELEQTLTSQELTEWMAYYRVEPFGPWRDDYRAGQVMALYANSKRGKGGKAFRASDFIPRWRRSTPEEIAESVKRWFTAFGGSNERRPSPDSHTLRR